MPSTLPENAHKPNASLGTGIPQREITYDDALRVCSREAAATLAAAILIFIFFWAAVWLLEDVPARLWGFPVWFIAAVAGGYLFSIAAVLWIVKRCFRPIPLGIRPSESEMASHSASAPAADGRKAR